MNVLAHSTLLPPIRERVAAGAAVLDIAAPGWAASVVPEQLSVHPLSTRISLIEHLRDGYAVELTDTIGHGICLSLADFDDPAGDPRTDLLDAWRDQVSRRQQTTTTTGGGG